MYSLHMKQNCKENMVIKILDYCLYHGETTFIIVEQQFKMCLKCLEEKHQIVQELNQKETYEQRDFRLRP